MMNNIQSTIRNTLKGKKRFIALMVTGVLALPTIAMAGMHASMSSEDMQAHCASMMDKKNDDSKTLIQSERS
ncbi:hypothetical protein N9R79_05245 [Vibrio sp.]|nr:hypothetical protein [Vibrio sp.]